MSAREQELGEALLEGCDALVEVCQRLVSIVQYDLNNHIFPLFRKLSESMFCFIYPENDTVEMTGNQFEGTSD